MSVEDIERNIRSQQTQQKSDAIKPTTPQHQRQLQQQAQVQAQQLQQQFQRPTAPPGLPHPKGPMGPHPMQLPPGLSKQAHQRLPPGFPPMNMMNQNIAGPPQPMHPNMGRPMPPNMPMALGNFAVS